MLVGRETERLALDRLLAQGRDGRSGVLAIVGEPGIGKTALLEYAHASASASGMRVLRARGVESEAEVPFAGLAELLRPALAAFDRIPAPQASTLAGALALAPATARDRFAIGAATLTLLSAFAEAAPIAVLVDDAHLFDESSGAALRFAARRLIAEPIAIVLTVREGERSLVDGSDLRELHLAGLALAEAAKLLEQAGLTEQTVERLHRATGGNPLALLELAPDASWLSAGPGVEPIPIGTSIAAAFVRRFTDFPEPTRRMLVLASANDAGTLAELARAGASIGADIADLAAAENGGLIKITGGEVTFRHPLARAAVYAQAQPWERRAAHAALAAALPDRDADRRAWHLAAASVGPSDQACAALDRAGVRARERSAYAVAAAAFERSAQLATSDEARGRLLFSAAEAAWLAGNSNRTSTLLIHASLYTAQPALIARIDQLRAHVAMRCGPVMDGYRLIVSAAERIAASDPELAVVMLAEAVHGSFYAGRTHAMLWAAERAVALADGLGSRRATFYAAMAHGMALVAVDQSPAGAAAVRRAVAIVEESGELSDDPRLLAWAVFGPIWLREAGTGRGLIERVLDQARGQAAVGVLAALLPYIARDQATSDQWPAAEASYDEAIRLARETGQRTELAVALAGLACLQARQGRETQCRAHAAEADALCTELGMVVHGAWAMQALGDLELALGRPEAALAHHQAQADMLRANGITDVDLSPAPELVEELLRLGRAGQAHAVAADFVVQAGAKGQPWALARAARCRGLLAAAEELESWFEEALVLHGRTPDGFEAARTRLAYGARLRRVKKRVRARAELRAALEIFDHLGAGPWADQASSELAATGETARRRDPCTLDKLTPQELQIARLLAGEKTTREAAAAIFLSPKTVEYHLRHIYDKLGIRSRVELAAAFKQPQ